MLLLTLGGLFLWEQKKNKDIVISVVLPVEYYKTEQEWISGMKECSKDKDIELNFFFQDKNKIKQVEKEQRTLASAVVTAQNRNEKIDDAFLDGYRIIEKLAEHSSGIRKTSNRKQLKVGIALYNEEDSFIANLEEDIKKILGTMEEEKGIQIVTAIEDACMDEQNQEKQIQYLMDQNCDVIAVNLVDTWSASGIIHRAKEKGIPLIFFNREPSAENLELWDKVAYIGSDGKNLGEMQAYMMAAEFSDHPQIDKNEDGILQYVLVEGEEGHSDSIRRTDSMYKKLKDMVSIEQIASFSAEWDREQAKKEFLALPLNVVEACEAVICNNDEMALGIMDACQERNIKKVPAIVGIDGTYEMIDEIQNGSVCGTISQNPKKQAEMIVKTIWKFWNSKENLEVPKVYISGSIIKK